MFQQTGDFTLREKLGGGNYGVTYEAVRSLDNGQRIMSRTLSSEEKKRRVVLKRVNLDSTSLRSDFLNKGTVAQGAAESGAVEVRPRACAVDHMIICI